VILWTRRPPSGDSTANTLRLELSEFADFRKTVSSATAKLSSAEDWTCRVLAAGLKPHQVYWYRFTDEHGFGSRVGRTMTAPAANADHTVRFAFVSCQNVQQGACNAYRRMIFEDEQRPVAEQLSFVLHLGDFIYEIVWYPEDRPQGMYSRRIRDIVRYKSGEKHSDFHVPTTVDDYRAVYKAYLLDPDLQDARARWPFVCMWDNHEFSWRGWQSQQDFGNGVLPAQTRKVAAAQAWFEYQPARVVKLGSANLNQFVAPKVADKKIVDFDEFGMGQEAGNIAAVKSLTLYRALRWGRHVDLVLTELSFATGG
jgi:alkaline phosphatase D